LAALLGAVGSALVIVILLGVVLTKFYQRFIRTATGIQLVLL
jgi:hypothetical protein